MNNIKLHRPFGRPQQEIKSLSNLTGSIATELRKYQEDYIYNTLRLSDDMLNELALVMAEFFEDITLDIGIWKSLEAYNIEFFNTPLLFFLKPGEKIKEEFLLKKRIQYLLWNKYSELIPDLILGPDHRDLNFISDKLAEYFINIKSSLKLKESSIKSFLNRSNEYGWVVKRKLLWLGQHSYLFRHSYKEYMMENKGNPEIPLIDDFVMQTTTRWSGLGVIDILASILNISAKQKKELRGWYEKHFSYYLIKSIKGDLVSAANIITDTKYTIRMGDDARLFNIGNIYLGSLVRWNKEWYWSGQQSDLGHLSPIMLEELKNNFFTNAPRIVYRYDKSLLRKAKERNKVHYENFVRFHGNEFKTFPDGYSMAASIQEQHRLEYEAGPPELVKKVMRERNMKNPWPNYSYPKELLESENGIGLYFNPETGQEIMPGFNILINGFSKKGKNLSDEEMDCIRNFFESGAISPAFVMKLVDQYGSRSIAKAYLIKETEEFDFLSYLLRIFKGHFYRNRYPNLSFN